MKMVILNSKLEFSNRKPYVSANAPETQTVMPWGTQDAGDIDVPTNLADDYDYSHLIIGDTVKLTYPASFANQTVRITLRKNNHDYISSSAQEILLDANSQCNFTIPSSATNAYYVRFSPGGGNYVIID